MCVGAPSGAYTHQKQDWISRRDDLCSRRASIVIWDPLGSGMRGPEFVSFGNGNPEPVGRYTS
jgi:hypothetical protein